MTDREILMALLAEARSTMRHGRDELAKLDDSPQVGLCREAVQRVNKLANAIDTKENGIETWTDRRCIIALISETRNALTPARFWLEKMPNGGAARIALQQMLDFTTEAVNDLEKP